MVGDHPLCVNIDEAGQILWIGDIILDIDE
jgi:hypothetical protein